MELSVYEMFDIGEEYQMRQGDYIVTYGIFKSKGRDGKYHDCHVEIKRVRKPIQKDTQQIIFESNMRIKELQEALTQQVIAANFNNAILDKLLKEKKQQSEI